MSLENLNANYGTITKLITFLLGFYVSNIINRWWNKVCYLLAHTMYIHIPNQMRFPQKNIQFSCLKDALLVFTWAANVLLAWTAGAFTNLEAILQPLKIFTNQH